MKNTWMGIAAMTGAAALWAVPVLAHSQGRGAASNGCSVAREYIRLTDEKRYDEVGKLWADDAVFFSPAGEIIRGAPVITQFYSRFLNQIKPVNRIASLAWDPKARVCVMEIETRVVRGPDGKWVPDASGNFVPTAIDRFQINRARKIQAMRVYLAPSKAWLGE